MSEHNSSLLDLYSSISDLEVYTSVKIATSTSIYPTAVLHAHDDFEIFSVCDGILKIENVSGSVIELKPGEVCIVPKNYYHCSYAVVGTPRRINLRFSYARAKEKTIPSLYNIFDRIMTSIDNCVILDGAGGMFEKLLEICDEITNTPLATEIYLRLLINQMYIRLMRLFDDSAIVDAKNENLNGNSPHFRKQRIDIWLVNNFYRQVTQNDIADVLGVSRRHVNRIFRDIYGMSFHEKLIEIRIRYAENFLISTNNTIEEIAYKVGYTSPSGFHLAFCRCVGISPGDYRRKHNKQSALPTPSRNKD